MTRARRPKYDANGLNPGLMSFEIRALWRALMNQKAPFWFLCTYVFIEYLRPQQMYPVLNVAPLGTISLLLCVGAVGVAWFRGQIRPGRINLVDVLFVGFSISVYLSYVYAWDPAASWAERTTFTSWILLYICVRLVLTSPQKMLLFYVFFALMNFKMSQHATLTFVGRGFSFARYGVSGGGVWFHNSGELAMEMGIFFAMSITLILAHRAHLSMKRRNILFLLFPFTAFMTVVASSNRGGQLAFLVICLGLIAENNRKLGRRAMTVALVLALGWIALPQQQKDRFSSAGEDKTSVTRKALWTDAIEIAAEHPINGIGYKNWGNYYAANYCAYVGRTWTCKFGERIFTVHNSTLEAFVELGVPGGGFFLALIGASLLLNFRTRGRYRDHDPTGRSMRGMLFGLNLGIVGAAIAGQFMAVLYYPMFWTAFALTAAFQSMPPPRPSPPPARRRRAAPRPLRRAHAPTSGAGV